MVFNLSQHWIAATLNKKRPSTEVLGLQAAESAVQSKDWRRKSSFPAATNRLRHAAFRAVHGFSDGREYVVGLGRRNNAASSVHRKDDAAFLIDSIRRVQHRHVNTTDAIRKPPRCLFDSFGDEVPQSLRDGSTL